MTNFKLETERLIIRPFNLDDAAAMYELNTDPDVLMYTGDKAFNSMAEVEDLINNYTQFEQYRIGRFTVLQKSDNEYVGWCGLNYNENGQVDLGYRFIKKYWGLGYATESAFANLNYGFVDLDLDEIIARADIHNIASINVMKKLGMQYVGRFEYNPHEAELYKITKKEFILEKHPIF